jgi:hypothetical protein
MRNTADVTGSFFLWVFETADGLVNRTGRGGENYGESPANDPASPAAQQHPEGWLRDRRLRRAACRTGNDTDLRAPYWPEHVTGGKPIAVLLQSISGVVLLILQSPFTTSMEERERCYSFILSRTPHETVPDDDYQYNFLYWFMYIYLLSSICNTSS